MFSEFFTLEMLVTFVGASLAVGVITEMFKKIGFLLTVPTQLISYVAAVIVLVAGNLALGTFAWNDLILILLNAGVIALTSNGGYDMVKRAAQIGDRNEQLKELEAYQIMEEMAHDPDIDMDEQ